MASSSKDLTKEQALDFYQKMLYYRRFEERVNSAYTKQKFSGFCHLHIGQEALCVGVQAVLKPTDYMISGYRSHTQAIAKGIRPEAVFSELLGKVDGCVKGKGGSMHMISKEHRFLGGHGIVGGQAPLATGVGFAIKYNEESDIIVCYLGDAAMNQGAVFEAMNMAATWNLPVLYIIENNQYGMGTAIKRTTSVDKLYKRALAFDMACSETDGMDVLKVYEDVSKIVEKMRKKNHPYLLEAHTYRFKGHSVSDPATYRTKEEVEGYLAKDPIQVLKKLILQKKWSTEPELDATDKKIKEQLREVEAFADNSPFPPIETTWTDVFAD